MRLRDVRLNFRFSARDVAKLDGIVEMDQRECSTMILRGMVSRASVVRRLIEGEYARLEALALSKRLRRQKRKGKKKS